MRRFLPLLFLSVLTLAARAQSVHWEGSSDDPSEVQLVFEDCSPDGDPQLPAMTDNALTLTGNSSQTSIINGSFSRSNILTYSARARRAGATLQIPAFAVQTNKGPRQVSAFTGGAARVISDSTINARLVPGSTTVWAGEVFPLTYVLDATRRSFSQIASNIDWNSAPLVVEDWSKPEPSEVSLNGEARLNITYRARAYAKASGPLSLAPATQLVNIATGSIGFGLFQQQRVEQLSVTSKRAELIVNPLPAPAPAGFSGAVGQFKLVSKVVPNSAAVGEPITWTLELSGTGNWPDLTGLPQREVSKDFQVVQPQAKRTPAEGKLFDATLAEDVVLVPTRPGTYVLNPVTFVYFDPKAAAYQTLTTARRTLTITPPVPVPGATPRFQVGLPDATLPAPADATTPRTAATPAAPPDMIPRDPLPGAAHAPVPLPDDQLLLLLASPLAALVIFWGWLAVQRAWQTDPARARREARQRLAATVARLRTAGETDRAALLLAWQHDAALLWEIRHAAPPPAAFNDEAWSRLWIEADRTLYRADTALPADWAARAEAALTAKQVSGFSPFAALRPRHLVPFLVAAVAILIIPSLRAEETTAYRRGDFAAAEKAWAADVARDPANPIARHNLSLALAQQDRWDLALAHATAALVQDPANDPIRWQFALAADKAGFLPAPLAAFPRPGPLQSLAQLASPGAWQRWLLGAALGVALALGFMLYGAYRRPSALRRSLAAVILGLSGLLAVAALLGLHAYGQTADARAVIVWRGSVLRSIPTEADTTQKSTTLAAGSVAVVDKTFISWVHLAFDNGQTGWVRQDDTVGLW
jgi:tetratricopeptide (TPR) repeat protein